MALVAPGRTLALVCACLGAGWLAMQAVHELGHVLGAWVSGGEVLRVELHPLAFSRTLLGRNPHPQLVCWAGPLLGCLLPALAWGALRWAERGRAYLARFFLGLCLLANGLYLGTGPWTRGGDPGDLLALGTPAWVLVALGVGASAAGLGCWNGLGAAFGVGREAEPPPRADAWGVAAAGLCLAVLGLALAS